MGVGAQVCMRVLETLEETSKTLAYVQDKQVCQKSGFDRDEDVI